MEEETKCKRSEYYKNYMRDYIKKQPKIKCDVCNGNYNKHQKYIHIKQKRHILQELLNEKKNQVLAYVPTCSDIAWPILSESSFIASIGIKSET